MDVPIKIMRTLIHVPKGQAKTRLLLLAVAFALGGLPARAQRYLTDVDSSLFVRDTVRPLVRRLENIRFSGYIQPQYQVASAKGAGSFEGGNFAPFSNNRFMLRRARIKVDYLLPSLRPRFPRASFTFQVDATERGVIARDVFLRLYPATGNNVTFTMGLFARPFGYEVNLSSAYRESPERSRASQVLMPGERDLGAMISFEGKGRDSSRAAAKLDIGAFNGQGPSGTTDFDSYKDVAARLSLRPLFLSRQVSVAAGLSALYGGWRQGSIYVYKMSAGSNAAFGVDSSLSNLGKKAPRRYAGADVQFVRRAGRGKTELRGEYWRGMQPGTDQTTVSPGSLPTGPTYLRHFDAGIFYLLQSIGGDKWEALLKYDWYDPNTKVSGNSLRAAGGLTAADMRFTTIGIGLTRYFTASLKILAYYDVVRNESTALPGLSTDARDDVLTLRMQLRF
ncbi:MAG: porin [Flaviaesturariibacter sp.]|nr:porin [Flaviaesturariibacter sp.]